MIHTEIKELLERTQDIQSNYDIGKNVDVTYLFVFNEWGYKRIKSNIFLEENIWHFGI